MAGTMSVGAGTRSFYIESKRYDFFMEEGKGPSSVKLFERGKYRLNSVFTGKEGARWLERGIEENIVREEAPAFVRTFREHDKGYVMRRDNNKHGRYLEVTEYGRGGCKGKIIIPEGPKLGGWRGFNAELRLLINQGTESDKVGRKTDEKGPRVEPRRAVTTAATSYADSLRAPAKSNSTIPDTGGLRITQTNRGKLVENPKIPGLRVNDKPKKGQTRDTERFLGYTEFRNRGKESVVNDTPKLTISVSGDGKRKVIWGNKGGRVGEGDKKVGEWIPRGHNNVGRVSKPNNKLAELVQVQPKNSFTGPSTYEEGESSNNPNPWFGKKRSCNPLVGAQPE